MPSTALNTLPCGRRSITFSVAARKQAQRKPVVPCLELHSLCVSEGTGEVRLQGPRLHERVCERLRLSEACREKDAYVLTPALWRHLKG